MKTYFTSIIEWVDLEKGGRKKIPPKGTRYCPIIQLNDKERTKWSIEFICPDFFKTDVIEFTFLVDNAPIEQIMINKTYNLYEGNKMVASLYVKKKSKGKTLDNL